MMSLVLQHAHVENYQENYQDNIIGYKRICKCNRGLSANYFLNFTVVLIIAFYYHTDEKVYSYCSISLLR